MTRRMWTKDQLAGKNIDLLELSLNAQNQLELIIHFDDGSEETSNLLKLFKTEDWTFTLDDGTQVTKKVVLK